MGHDENKGGAGTIAVWEIRFHLFYPSQNNFIYTFPVNAFQRKISLSHVTSTEITK